MQQTPILILDTSEDLSSLKIEYITNDSFDKEINGEAVSHICHVKLITEHILRELSDNENEFGISVSEEDILAIATASSLHDIGKQQIAKSILDSPNTLSPVEYDIVKKHSALGEKSIRGAQFDNISPEIMEYAAQIARSHHERIDGLGYPDGLVGDAIPLCAQVVAIADVYDALTSVRSYKQAFTQDVALQMIASGNCGAFDERLVICLNRVVKHQALVSFSEYMKKRLRVVNSDGALNFKRVLIAGNTEYLDKDFSARTFPQSKVTIVDSTGVKISAKEKLLRSRKASLDTILETFEFDLIVYFAAGIGFHSSEKSDAEELRKMLKLCSKLQKKAKILYLSPLDAAFESRIDRAITASANESMCDFYAKKHALDIKTVRIPYLYSSTYKKDFLNNIFEQLYAKKIVTIPESPLSKMHFLSVEDLSELILRIVDNWKSGAGILSVGDEFKLTFSDLAKKITELDENAKVDFTESDCSGTLRVGNTDLRYEYGWYAKISFLDDLQEQYERFLESKDKKSFFKRAIDWISSHSLIIKTIELFLLFAISEFLMRLTNSTVIFSLVDFRTIFVVIIATMYGTSFGIASAFLASISYFVSRVEAGTNALTIFYEPTNWIAFVLFFLVGGLCGYIQLKNKDHCQTVDEQSILLEDKLAFTNELYTETLQDKKELQKQIITSKDSFGKILNITKTLNSVVSHQLYLKIIETFEEALENKSIAVYSVKPQTPYGRLQVASRETIDTVSRSILLDDYKPVIDKIKNGEIWRNTDLNLNYPAYAAGVYRENELVTLIFLWHANVDQRSLYYVNLFKVLCDLAQISLLRAYDYNLALYEKQYISNTRIMHAKYFAECVEDHIALSEKKISSFVMLEFDINGHTLEEVNGMLSTKIRTTDFLGLTSDGKLQLILPNASKEDMKYILPRFDGLDIHVKIIR